MKMFYLNDERQAVVVRIMDSRYDPVTATGDIYVTLQPAEGKVFEILLPEGTELYIKKWPNMVMFSHIDVSALDYLGRPLQD